MIKKILIGVGITFVLAIIIGASSVYLLLEKSCGNYLINEIASPNMKFKAVIFQRDCGATTGFSTQVSILPMHKTLVNKPGNIFVIDTDHGKAPSGPGGGPEIKINWQSDNDLLIQHHRYARIFKSETKFKEINIEFSIFGN